MEWVGARNSRILVAFLPRPKSNPLSSGYENGAGQLRLIKQPSGGPNAAITCPQSAMSDFRNILDAGQVHGNVILYLE
jgi:hypothetical protein